MGTKLTLHTVCVCVRVSHRPECSPCRAGETERGLGSVVWAEGVPGHLGPRREEGQAAVTQLCPLFTARLVNDFLDKLRGLQKKRTGGSARPPPCFAVWVRRGGFTLQVVKKVPPREGSLLTLVQSLQPTHLPALT